MFSERTSVRLDVHARSVVACAIDTVTGELTRSRLTPQHADVLDWLGRLPGPVAVAYEAGPSAFGGPGALRGARSLTVAASGLTLPWNSGVVEGHVNRIKMLKRQMFGRAGFALLRKRVLLAP
ncbi:hypothetical protein [Streptomyces sp. NPDC101234]|uniref:hypothetical protein n=1 Tax=Streptomyces sp. NPDC101234 TaxID=3366138 RepID=UPI0038123449